MALRVNYYFDSRSFYFIDCQKTDTIGSFLHRVLKRNGEEEEEEIKDDFFLPAVCLKGKVIPKEDNLEKYIDDLHYYAFFISTDPTKEIQINPTPTNLHDYQFQELVKGRQYIIKANHKKTNKKVIIHFFGESYGSCGNYVKAIYMNHLFNSPSIPRYIGHYFSVDDDTLNKFCKDIWLDYNSFYVVEDNLSDFNIEDVRNYLTSKGTNKTKMNPTKRSKLIFGFASIMKKIHQKRIAFYDMNNKMIQLDENYEPYITDFSTARFLTDKSNEDHDDTPYIIYCPIELIDGQYNIPIPPSNVYSFAFFLYSMFNPESNITLDDQKKIPKTATLWFARISRGARAVRLESIPDHYWELIEHCWSSDPKDRPSFDSIVEILKDDKFALTEFGIETNLAELHEYQNRIENAVTNYESK